MIHPEEEDVVEEEDEVESEATGETNEAEGEVKVAPMRKPKKVLDRVVYLMRPTRAAVQSRASLMMRTLARRPFESIVEEEDVVEEKEEEEEDAVEEEEEEEEDEVEEEEDELERSLFAESEEERKELAKFGNKTKFPMCRVLSDYERIRAVNMAEQADLLRSLDINQDILAVREAFSKRPASSSLRSCSKKPKITLNARLSLPRSAKKLTNYDEEADH